MRFPERFKQWSRKALLGPTAIEEECPSLAVQLEVGMAINVNIVGASVELVS